MSEGAIDHQVLRELRELSKLVGEMKIELLGRDGSEEHGRLSKVEAEVRGIRSTSETDAERIDALERQNIWVKGYVAGAMGVCVLLGTLLGYFLEHFRGH